LDQAKVIAETSGILISASPYSSRRGFLERLRRTGGYESQEISCASALLKLGDRVLELGAGLGVVSAVLAKSGLPAAIRCYEANPELIEHIKQLYVLNGVDDKIDLRNAILLTEPGPSTVPFYVANRFAYSSLVKPDKMFSHEVQISTENFDAVLNSFSPDILIIDIEGGEKQFLEKADLTGIRGICIEFHPNVYGIDGMRSCKRLLRKYGFSPIEKVSTRTVWAAQRE
jgi:FkbM family methyltransferase